MLNFLSRGCWRDIVGGRGFSWCFWWLHGGSAVWVWKHLVEFYPKCVPRSRWPLETLQVQPGLVMTFLRPTSQRNWLPQPSSVPGYHSSLCRLVLQVPTPSMCLCHQLLTTYIHPHSGGLLPACPGTVDQFWNGQTSQIPCLLVGWTPALGKGPLSNFGLPWMPSFSMRIIYSVSLHLIALRLSELNNSLY